MYVVKYRKSLIVLQSNKSRKKIYLNSKNHVEQPAPLFLYSKKTSM